MTDRVLNVGSGGRPHAEWTNLDIVGLVGTIRSLRMRTRSPNFVKHRLPKPLPFENGSFDAIYCAQVVEHFDRDDARQILREFCRILVPGGFARIIVPDLERQARSYLVALERSRSDGRSRIDLEDYEFSKLWLIEQFVRRSPGGELSSFLRSASPSLLARKRLIASTPNRVVAALPRHLRHLSVLRSGQLHQWAYDGVDLETLALSAGFSEVKLVDAATSHRIDFQEFDNDELGELQIGSLYAECKV